MAENLPTKVEDVIANRIGAQFVEPIPEEAFTNMVKKEIAWFTTERDLYRNNISTSPLIGLIRMELERRFKDMLVVEFNKPGYNEPCRQNGGMAHGEAAQKIIKDCLPEIVAAAWGGVIQMAINNLRSSLPRPM